MGGSDQHMEWAIFIYSAIASIVLLWFAKNRKYYEKTVDAYGKSFADKTFAVIKFAGFLMMIGAVCILIFIVYTAE
jgi:hypothetical protein